MEKKDYILIVTANENETEALLNDRSFVYNDKQRSNLPYDVSFYNIGKYGYYNVVHFELITEGVSGADAALLSIANAIDAFHPKAVILAGIAFGKDFSDDINKKQKIGDVLISTMVADYESGKVKNKKLQSDGFIAESGRELISIFKNYSRSWNYKINNEPARCECGLILSGDKVVDDKDFKKALMQRYPRAIGGEMEGRGAYSACRNRGVSEWIIIKSICDWADGTKSDNKKIYQKIASTAAVSLLNHIFTNKKSLERIAMPIEQDITIIHDDGDDNIHKTTNIQESKINIISEMDDIQKIYLDTIFNYIKSDESKFNAAKKMIAKFTTCDNAPIDFSKIIKMILSCNEKMILTISGLRGTGKSTLFTLIYLELKNKINNTNTFPILIDLKMLSKKPIELAQKILNEHLSKINQLINTYPTKRFFIMFDGMNEYVLENSKLENIVNNYILNDKRYSKSGQNFAFCVGNTESLPIELYHINKLYSLTIKSKFQVNVNRINSASYSNLDDIINQLIYIYSFDIDSSLIPIIKKTIDDYTINHVDYRTLLILLRVFEWNKKRNEDWHLGNCFFNYYLEYFKGDETTLYKCAKTAYDHVILHSKLKPLKYKEIIYNNGITTDFFLSLYFVKIMRFSQENLRQVLGEGFVFTALVNKFIKELLNTKFKAEQYLIVNNMIKSYHLLDDSMKSQICYILGRVQGNATKKNAKTFLIEQWEKIYEELFNKNIIKIHKEDIMNTLILFRTISVSLITLGNDTKLEDFLQCTLYNEKLNQINRGFHLEYYEDKSYLNGVSPTYLDDKSTPAHRTMNYLIDSINDKISFKTTLNKSIYLDIITLFSIYQYRIDDTNFFNMYHDKLHDIICEVSSSPKIQSNTVRNYIQTMSELLEFKSPIKYILSEVNGVKTTKRQGWVDRKVSFPESIADHMYGCYLNGIFLLPNNINQCIDYKIPDIEAYIDYSKDHILQMLLLHDLAETKEGDIISQKKNSQDIEKENLRFDYYQYLCSFPKIYGLGIKRELWDEFAANSTINAQIANDLDKVEPVIQAFFYYTVGNRIDLNEWIEYANNRISTSLVKQIFQYLIDNLLNFEN